MCEINKHFKNSFFSRLETSSMFVFIPIQFTNINKKKKKSKGGGGLILPLFTLLYSSQ